MNMNSHGKLLPIKVISNLAVWHGVTKFRQSQTATLITIVSTVFSDHPSYICAGARDVFLLALCLVAIPSSYYITIGKSVFQITAFKRIDLPLKVS